MKVTVEGMPRAFIELGDARKGNVVYQPRLAGRVGLANSGPKYWTPTLIPDRESIRAHATS